MIKIIEEIDIFSNFKTFKTNNRNFKLAIDYIFFNI